MARTAEVTIEVPEHVKRFCQFELSFYKVRKARLQDRRIEISDPGRQQPENDRVSGGGITTRPTETRAMALLTDTDILVDSRYCQAVEDVLDWLDADERKFTNLHFFEGKPPEHLEHEIGFGKSTLYRTRAKIIRLLAFRLGLIG